LAWELEKIAVAAMTRHLERQAALQRRAPADQLVPGPAGAVPADWQRDLQLDPECSRLAAS
jgi:hypothetical protein